MSKDGKGCPVACSEWPAGSEWEADKALPYLIPFHVLSLGRHHNGHDSWG